MVQWAAEGVRAGRAGEAHASPRRGRVGVAVLLGVVALAVSFGLLPLAYGLSTFGPNYHELVTGDVLEHVLRVCACNAMVMLWSLRLTGRLDRKIAGVLTRVLLVHGGLAFFTLISRHFYSSQVMLEGAASSAVLGAGVMYLQHRAIRVHAALLGPWHPIAAQVHLPCDRIDDPAADLRRYDLLLTASVTDLSPEWAQALSRAMLAGKPVRHLAEYLEEDRGVVSVEHFQLDHLPAGGLTSYSTRKRLMDVGLALLCLPLALPILALGALVVLLTMGWPVLFVQDRAGRGGRVFRMYKLRTMRPARAAERGVTTLKGDVRITPAGRWLRRFRIDELPQLWNVLKGDMSMVGPRPEWTALTADYVRELPAYAYRHLVRPGITGWAQVRGGYAADLAETRQKVGYDLFYIKNLSFALDVQILIRTVWTLLSGGGAR